MSAVELRNVILNGDVREQLRLIPDETVNCVVTSPPYWGLRDYGTEGQLGLEPTPEEYVCNMVEVFRDVRRVLKKDGTLWLNLGDSYAGSGRGMNGDGTNGKVGAKQATNVGSNVDFHDRMVDAGAIGRYWVAPPPGLKAKDLVGIPWRVAFALQADGWWLRSDIIWSKPNPMPESVTDRPTKAHEYVFLLSKSQTYYYDADAIKEPATYSTQERQARAFDDHKSAPTSERNGIRGKNEEPGLRRYAGFNERWEASVHMLGTQRNDGDRWRNTDGGVAPRGLTRNRRTVWEIATKPYPEAHFATYPEDLVKPCILAGCPEGGIVLDPFLGSGTTASVAKTAGRDWIGIELNPTYVELAKARINVDQERLL